MSTIKAIASAQYRSHHGFVGDPVTGPVDPHSPEAQYRAVMNRQIKDVEIQDCFHQLVLTTQTNEETPYRLWVYATPGGILVDLAPSHGESFTPPSPLEAWLPIRVALYRYGSATEISRWEDYLHLVSDLPIQLDNWIQDLWRTAQS